MLIKKKEEKKKSSSIYMDVYDLQEYHIPKNNTEMSFHVDKTGVSSNLWKCDQLGAKVGLHLCFLSGPILTRPQAGIASLEQRRCCTFSPHKKKWPVIFQQWQYSSVHIILTPVK